MGNYKIKEEDREGGVGEKKERGETKKITKGRKKVGVGVGKEGRKGRLSGAEGEEEGKGEKRGESER